MKGIDIYHGESLVGTKLKPTPEKAYKESDFVIVKSTQGVSYKYTSFFNKMIERVLNDGKLAGAYHYAAGNDPIEEADYFISIVKPYIGKILLCLDWESMQNKAWGSKTWCTKFINRVKEKTGITCVLYTGEDGCIQNKTLAGKVPLWFARYPKPQRINWEVPKLNWNLGVWKNYDIWQYTSTNEKVDRNTTKWTSKKWMNNATGDDIVQDLLNYLDLYNRYIKKHYKKFFNEYDGDITTFAKAKSAVEKGKKVGLTCVVPLRWALYELGIVNGSGKSLISAPDGSFEQYYSGGNVSKYLTCIKSGSPIGMTVKEAVDKKLLKPGDIVCYKDHTHTSVYLDGYNFYEGGSQCDNYKNGIKVNYKNYSRKISEILRWKDAKPKKETPKTTPTQKGNYTGKIPTVPKTRSYYKLGDGYKTMPSHKDDIKNVQKALNWAINAGLKVDGQYGDKTRKAVIAFEKKYSLKQDGLWGKACNKKLGEIKK